MRTLYSSYFSINVQVQAYVKLPISKGKLFFSIKSCDIQKQSKHDK